MKQPVARVLYVYVVSLVIISKGAAQNQKNKAVVCSENLVLCHDGTHCIEKTRFCDNVSDCSDFSDELFCGDQICQVDEFPCWDGQLCIPRQQVCDHSHDCHDGSDEDVCEPSEKCGMEYGRYLCQNGRQCISMTRLCDNKFDCHDNSDEGNKCAEAKRNCSKGLCNQICIPTPTGALCQCRKGYHLQDTTCEDIDECENQVCSQHCSNLPGSYHCSCVQGYNIQSNGSCLVSGPDPVLYIASYNKILSYKIRSPYTEAVTVVDDLKHVQNIATDGKHLYWTDSEDKAVYGYDIESQHRPWKVIDTGIETPAGLAVDTVTSHLYIVDTSKNRIIVCNAYGDLCTVIMENLASPSDVKISYKYRKLIWCEVAMRKPGIMKSELNGNLKEILISDDIQHPHSMTIDEPLDRLYWVDSVLDRIESIQLDGSDRKIVMSRKLKHPFDIAVFEDNMYWADLSHTSVMSANKFNSRRHLPLATGISHVTSFVIDHSVLRPTHYIYGLVSKGNPCLEHQCGEICLPFQESFTCACSHHKLVDNDNKTCIDNTICSSLLVGETKAILKYPLCGIGKRDHLVSYITAENMKQMSIIGQHDSMVVYQDIGRGLIAKIDMNEAKTREIVLYNDLHTVTDVCIDWSTGVMYWTDPVMGVIQAGSLNGSLIITLVQEGFQRPYYITFDPEERKIYFFDAGDKPNIVVCNTDGKMCSLIDVKVSLVNDLVFDHISKRLFYTEDADHSIHAISVNNDHHIETIYSGMVGEKPSSIAISQNMLYWTDSKKQSVMSIQITGRDRLESIVLEHLAKPNGIILTESAVVIENDCTKDNGDCMHFCFVTTNGKICQCQDGWTLEDDNKSCHVKQQVEKNPCNEANCREKLNITSAYVPVQEKPPCTKFLCNDGMCIDKRYVCDGHPDCYDKSDELNCSNRNKLQGSSQPLRPCDNVKEYRCGSGECIPLYKVCDGTLICEDGSDESRMCDRTCENSPCNQNCHPTPKGPVCSCETGYQLSSDNVTCLDINECNIRNGLCSQHCFNKNGSHVCSCQNGYLSRENGSSCVANGPRPNFVIGLYSGGIVLLNDLQQSIDLDLGETSKKVVAIDVDVQSEHIYFSSNKEIHIYSLKTRSTKTILTGLGYVADIAFDWVGDNLYVADEKRERLLVCSMKIIPTHCKTILYEEVRSIALDPSKGKMFFSSLDKKQIFKISMNGDNRQVVIETDIVKPGSLALDLPANRLYWVDPGQGRVESADLDGNYRYIVIEEQDRFGFNMLDVFENDLYTTEVRTNSLMRLDKFGNSSPVMIKKLLDMPSSVKVMQPVLQKKAENNICQLLNCSQLCLLEKRTAQCACFDGYLLNNSKCINMNIKPTVSTEEISTKNQKTVLENALKKAMVTTLSAVIKVSSNLQTGTEIIEDQRNQQIEPCHLECQHGGLCVKNSTEDKCVCKSGFGGKLCEIKQNESDLKSYSWLIGLVLVILALTAAVTSICYMKFKGKGINYIPCRKKSDDTEEGLVTEMSENGPQIGVFQEFDDINYPNNCSITDLNTSCQSVDSAFVSKTEDGDSESSAGSGSFSYMPV